MAALARAVDASGIRKVRGRVMGATTGFQRDWWAPGWQDYFPRDYIPLPTALTFEGNEDTRGVHIRDPERRAARSLTKRAPRTRRPRDDGRRGRRSRRAGSATS